VDLEAEHRETKRFNRSIGRGGGWIGSSTLGESSSVAIRWEAMIAMGRVPPVRGKRRRREGDERRWEASAM
jgi:hypothetical protein